MGFISLTRIGQIGACFVPVLMDWAYIHFKGLQVLSVMSFEGNCNAIKVFKDSMDMIASKKMDLKSLITHHYKLEDIDKAFKDVESGNVIKGIFTFE